MFSFRTVSRPPSAAKIVKNIRFGTARGLTETAKQGQAAVVGALQGTFTLRGQWFRQSNRFGIKVKPAKPNDLKAVIGTNADWLEPHETGKDKTGRGGRVAVPTGAVRRNKRQIITKANRPRNIKQAFIIKTKRGPVVATRMAKWLKHQGPTMKGGPTRRRKRDGTQLTILYGLENRVRIRKQSTFYEPIEKVVKRRLNQNVVTSIENALRTMR